MSEIFSSIKRQEVLNVEDLLAALKDKKKVQQFSDRSGIDKEYLEVLAREIKGFRQKPNSIKDFPLVSQKSVLGLEKLRVKNAKDFFEKVISATDRQVLASQTGIDITEILRLTKLVDLSRIRWVNHTFAYVLYEAGYDNAEKVATADFKVLYEEIRKLNKERGFYNAHIGLRDMKRCVDGARRLSFDIIY